MNLFQFAQPLALWGLILIPAAIIFYVLVFRWKKQALQRFGNLELLERLMPGISRKRQIVKVVLVVSAIFLLIISIARLQIGTKLEEVKSEGIDIVFAIDTSYSMLAEDYAPNRITRAKIEMSNLLDKLNGDRVGIVVFAGDAFLQCPLTLDYDAVKLFIDVIDTDIISLPGTNVAKAIEVAGRQFDTSSKKSKVIILMTDGEDHSKEAVEMARAAAADGIRIYTIGIGSQAGVPIPIKNENGEDEGFKKDASGQNVMTKLNLQLLTDIAFETDGKYYHATHGELELDKIFADIEQIETKVHSSRRFTQYEDRYQYTLALAALLICIEALLPDKRKVKKEWRGRFA